MTCCLFRTQLKDIESFNTEVTGLRAAKADLKRDLDAANISKKKSHGFGIGVD